MYEQSQIDDAKAICERMLAGKGSFADELATCTMVLIKIRNTMLAENNGCNDFSLQARRMIQDLVFAQACSSESIGDKNKVVRGLLVSLLDILPKPEIETQAAAYYKQWQQQLDADFAEEYGILQNTYIIKDQDSTLVKIGRSSNVQRRAQQLAGQSGRNLDILAIITGDVEKQLHEKFKQLRTRGEWFDDPNSDIINYIKTASFEID